MKNIFILSAIFVSASQLYAASGTENAVTFKDEKKRIKEYLYEGRREEVWQACKNTRRYTNKSTPFVLQHRIDDSFSQLSPKFRAAKTVEDLLAVEKQARTLNNLLIQLLLTVDKACSFYDTIFTASQEELESIAPSIEQEINKEMP